MSQNPPKSLEIMAHVRGARAELARLHSPATLFDELERTSARRQSERELTRHLARLGAILCDAVGQGSEAAQRLVAELTAGSQARPVAPEATPPMPEIEPPSTSSAETAQAREPVAAREPQETVVAPAKSIEPDDAAPAVLEITPDLCARLNARLRAGATEPDSEAPAMTKARRQELAKIAGYIAAEPNNIRGPKPVEAEVTRLEFLFSETADTWAELGRPLNHALVTYFAAAARRVQAVADKERKGKSGLAIKARIKALFLKLTRHSKVTQPGAAQGLARDDKPVDGDWHNNVKAARALLEALHPQVDWAPPRSADSAPRAVAAKPPAASPDEAFRCLRRKVDVGLDAAEFVSELWTIKAAYALSERDSRLLGLARTQRTKTPELDLGAAGLKKLDRALREDAEDNDDDHDDTPWTYQSSTRGLRAVIVGGDRRPERECAIKDDLDLEELTWITTDQGMRHVQSLEGRIESGNVDLVLVVQRFISHKATDKLFRIKSSSARIVLVPGYGLTSIRRGLERHLLGITD